MHPRSGAEDERHHEPAVAPIPLASGGSQPAPAAQAPRHRHGDRVAGPARDRGSALRWIAPVRRWQLAAWEVALLVVGLTVDQATPVRGAGLAVAVAVVLTTSVRVSGCCLSQWACTLAGYRRRQRSAARRPAAAPLATLVPDLKLCEHVDRAGNRVGLAVVGDGLTAVVRLAPGARPALDELLTVLREVSADTMIPLAGAQLVVWTAAAPPQPGRAGRVPMRLYWLALRYRPGHAPRAALARGGGETGAMRAAASAALGLAVRLDGAGYSSTVLDRVLLAQELEVALGGAAGTSSQPPPAVRETWRSWSAAGVRQSCYLPDHSLNPAVALDRWVPWAAFSCASYTLAATPRGQLRGEVVIRLGDTRPASGTTSVTRARRPTPRSEFGRFAVPTTGRTQQYVLRTLPLAMG